MPNFSKNGPDGVTLLLIAKSFGDHYNKSFFVLQCSRSFQPGNSFIMNATHPTLRNFVTGQFRVSFVNLHLPLLFLVSCLSMCIFRNQQEQHEIIIVIYTSQHTVEAILSERTLNSEGASWFWVSNAASLLGAFLLLTKLKHECIQKTVAWEKYGPLEHTAFSANINMKQNTCPLYWQCFLTASKALRTTYQFQKVVKIR